MIKQKRSIMRERSKMQETRIVNLLFLIFKGLNRKYVTALESWARVA